MYILIRSLIVCFILFILSSNMYANDYQRINIKVSKSGTYKIKVNTKKEKKINITMLVGAAYNKIDCKTSSVGIQCKQSYNPTVGMGLTYKLTDRLNMGVYYFSNQNVFLSVGMGL